MADAASVRAMLQRNLIPGLDQQPERISVRFLRREAGASTAADALNAKKKMQTLAASATTQIPFNDPSV